MVAAALLVASAGAFAAAVGLERSTEAHAAASHRDADSNPAIIETPATAQRDTTAPSTTASAPAPARPGAETNQTTGGDHDSGAAAGEGHPTSTTVRQSADTGEGQASTSLVQPKAASGAPVTESPPSEGRPDNAGEAGHVGAGESHASETLLGVNPEATPLVVSAVVVSLLLAAAILAFGWPIVAAIIVLAMLAFAALDIREVLHQVTESRPGLAALAALVALLHVAALGAATVVGVSRIAATDAQEPNLT
jgi:hypothetical protein